MRRWIMAISLIVVVLVSSGCGADGKLTGLNRQVNSIVRPHTFSLFGWQVNALIGQVKQGIRPPHTGEEPGPRAVISYFSCISGMQSLQSDIQAAREKNEPADLTALEARLAELEEQKAALQRVAEKTIARQIAEVLAEEGIDNPFSSRWLGFAFPPVNFKLENPPHMLIISPRDKIERILSVTLEPDINLSRVEELESSVEELDVSALIVPIGGLGATYPSFVSNRAGMRFAIETAAHEWLHHYLSFQPLGFRYILDLLGIKKNYDIGILNETVANIAGRELGNAVFDRYYAPLLPAPAPKDTGEPDFDFNAAMRQTRLTVDEYLARGQIGAAEAFMEEQRRYLASRGYHIRKLNQAYFAFYGSYADSPTSVDPIGEQMKLLRERSSSLKEFLDSVSGLGSREQLVDLVERFD